MKKMGFDQFCDYINIISGDFSKELRLGQYCMIVLYEIDKEIYSYITGTRFDPFYDTKKTNIFLSHLLENYVRTP
jgi:hypothetical protein